MHASGRPSACKHSKELSPGIECVNRTYMLIITSVTANYQTFIAHSDLIERIPERETV
jgi:hypothetical protein